MVSGSEPNELPALQATVSALQIQNAALRQLVVIHDRLSALVLQGADVSAITRMIANLVGRLILLLDALLQLVPMAAPTGLFVYDFHFAPRPHNFPPFRPHRPR